MSAEVKEVKSACVELQHHCVVTVKMPDSDHVMWGCVITCSLVCSSDDEVSKASMMEGRGSGRSARRRKRIFKMRAKEAIAREERHARKELVKVIGPSDSQFCVGRAVL